MARLHRLTDFEPLLDDPLAVREHRRQRLTLAYRIFGALRWGALGDGHITARDPVHSDHYWVSRYGVPFHELTADDLVMVAPDGRTVDGDRDAVNPAAHLIHWPIHEARPDVVSAAHIHTPYGTPFAAEVRQIEPISQEACAFVDDHAIFDDEELDIVTLDGGKRIAAALGSCRAITLRNHGHLTVGASVDEALGWFVMFERVAEAHVKAGDRARPISLDGARRVKQSIGTPEAGWHAFQWLVSTYL